MQVATGDDTGLKSLMELFTLKDSILVLVSIGGSLWASFVCARYIEFRQAIRSAMNEVVRSPMIVSGPYAPDAMLYGLVAVFAVYSTLWDLGQRKAASVAYAAMVEHFAIMKTFTDATAGIDKTDAQKKAALEPVKTSMKSAGMKLNEIPASFVWLLLGGRLANLVLPGDKQDVAK